MLSIGDRVQNYRVEEQLQTKSMVCTYLVADDAGKKYVLKQLKEKHREDSRVYKSFIGEYLLAQKTEHDQLLPVIHVFREEAAVLFPHLDGISLREWIQTKGSIEPLRALKWGAQVLSALNVLHQRRIVHLEVCPENIFLVEKKHAHHAILMDHGISLRGSVGELQIPSHRLHYWSPELLANPSAAKFRSDIYSLGAVLFEMMSGKKMIAGSFYVTIRCITTGTSISDDALKISLPPDMFSSVQLLIKSFFLLSSIFNIKGSQKTTLALLLLATISKLFLLIIFQPDSRSFFSNVSLAGLYFTKTSISYSLTILCNINLPLGCNQLNKLFNA